MDLHNLKGAPRQRPRRVGRGHRSGMGKTSSRGHKGQMARAGAKRKPLFEGGQMPLVRRIPKRGFTSPNATVYVTVNLAALAAIPTGTEVTPESLRTARLAQGPKGFKVKILGHGDLPHPLSVRAHAFSASARAKIEAAGGSCDVIS